MLKIISWWVRNSKAANLLMASIIILGVMTFSRIEKEVFPIITAPIVSVQYSWPGASPKEIEDQVITRAEESLTDLDGIKKIRSVSRENFGTMYVEATLAANIDTLIQDVKRKVDAITSIPQDVYPPIVSDESFRIPLITLAIHGNVSEKKLARIAEKLRDDLALVPYVDLVKVSGNRKEEISIELSENAMRRYNVTFDQVADAIRKSSINISAGSIKGQNGTIQLTTRNLADSSKEFDQIIIRQTQDGGTLKVSDVAKVVDGFEDQNLRASLNGELAILVQVLSTENMNVVKTSKSVNDWLPPIQESMPLGVTLSLWSDTSELYKGRMATISRSAFGGLFLVMIVLMTFLRPIVAFWCSVGILTSFAGTFIFLPSYDVSLNVISLFAFLLVIGIVVDDAIIIGENIHAEHEKGRRGADAAIMGAYLVSKPVFFAVMTTMIAFLPWLFLSGWQVQFVRNISIIVLFALAFSLIEAFLILPAHLSNLKPDKSESKLSKFQKRLAKSLVDFGKNRYMPILISSLKRRYLAASFFFSFLIIIFTFSGTSWIGKSFLPNIEDDEILVSVSLPAGSPFERTLSVQKQVQEAGVETIEFYKNKDLVIENTYINSRENNVMAYFNLYPPGRGQGKRKSSASEIADVLREKIGDIPDAEGLNVANNIGREPGQADLAFNITSKSSEDLLTAIEDFMNKLRSYSSTYDVTSSFNSSLTEIQIKLKPNAEKLGLTLGEISRQLRQAYYGQEVQKLPREGEDVRVMVRYPKKLRRSYESLSKFRIRTPDGREVPFLSLAEVKQSPGVQKIERIDGMISATIKSQVKGDLKSQILSEFKLNFLPEWQKRHPTSSWQLAGEAEGEDEFFAEIQILVVIAILSMFGL
ncbi:MAG: efflux RND transporter permease subunit, partial [Alphaproteobacteria bacterium]|nr:efflux RND transporter permease subunit [Alphaproteobacteria bacterium]